MKTITSSATRLTLLAIVLTLCAGVALVTMANVDDPKVVDSMLSLFQNVSIAVVAFYFGQKSPAAQIQQVQAAPVPVPVPAVSEPRKVGFDVTE